MDSELRHQPDNSANSRNFRFELEIYYKNLSVPSHCNWQPYNRQQKMRGKISLCHFQPDAQFHAENIEGEKHSRLAKNIVMKRVVDICHVSEMVHHLDRHTFRKLWDFVQALFGCRHGKPYSLNCNEIGTELKTNSRSSQGALVIYFFITTVVISDGQ